MDDIQLVECSKKTKKTKSKKERESVCDAPEDNSEHE